MNELYYHSFQCELGTLWLYERDTYLVKLSFGTEPTAAISKKTPLLLETEQQIRAYLSGRLRQFHLNIRPQGTLFQQKVWNLLLTIPYGDQLTYGEVAHLIDAPHACRAVGNACRCNPLPILIPCHRITPANQQTGNYIGGKANKIKLLQLEQYHRL